MKKILIAIFLIAMMGAVTAYDCNSFTIDGNGNYIIVPTDTNGSLKLCNWNDLNTLIQLDLNRAQLIIDLNNAITARDQYFDEMLTAKGEVNIYKPKAEQLEGEIDGYKTATTTAETQRDTVKAENTKLSEAIYTKLDTISETSDDTKTVGTAFTVLLADYVEKDKTISNQALQECQTNNQSMTGGLAITAIIAALLPAYYIVRTLRRKIKLPKPKEKLGTPQAPIDYKAIETAETQKMKQEMARMKKQESERKKELAILKKQIPKKEEGIGATPPIEKKALKEIKKQAPEKKEPEKPTEENAKEGSEQT